MTVHLVVVRAFGPYAKGDLVTAPAEVAEILAGEHAGHVVRVRAPSSTSNTMEG
jgi:hypothetical protein